jgi:hypothetical protein
MSQLGDVWHLYARDDSDGIANHVSVTFDSSDYFTEAEWIQEDPSNVTAGWSAAPYASTSPVTFSALDVNGHEPTLNYYDASALAISSGTYLQPTPLRADGFTLVPVTGAARNFLSIYATTNNFLVSVNASFSVWASLSIAQQRFYLLAFATAMTHEARALDSYTWPAADAGSVRAVAQAATTLASQYRVAARHPTPEMGILDGGVPAILFGATLNADRKLHLPAGD